MRSRIYLTACLLLTACADQFSPAYEAPDAAAETPDAEEPEPDVDPVGSYCAGAERWSFGTDGMVARWTLEELTTGRWEAAEACLHIAWQHVLPTVGEAYERPGEQVVCEVEKGYRTLAIDGMTFGPCDG